MALAKLDVKVVQNADSTFTVSVTNQSELPALMLRLNLVNSKTGKQILPAFYDDNYFCLLGGETKTIYALAPNDTIRKNEVFSYDNTIWSSSNAYAVVMGTAALHIDRTSDGWVKNLRIPLINGDARKDASFEDYMDLRDIYYARNSAGSII